jgi:hypothetical protein
MSTAIETIEYEATHFGARSDGTYRYPSITDIGRGNHPARIQLDGRFYCITCERWMTQPASVGASRRCFCGCELLEIAIEGSEVEMILLTDDDLNIATAENKPLSIARCDAERGENPDGPRAHIFALLTRYELAYRFIAAAAFSAFVLGCASCWAMLVK